jgi:SAM-dependent methyltransferase
MQDLTYQALSEVEKTHWWFLVRANLFAKYLKFGSKNSTILDVGSGPGNNLRMLKNLGFKKYQGFDFSQIAKNLCEEKELGEVLIGDICCPDLPSNFYDFVLATDLLEHIEEDSLALEQIARILKPGGKLIITVPCFKILWGFNDEASHHKRRYLLPEIKSKVELSQMKVLEFYYFNFFLFLPILIFRKVTKFFDIRVKNENLVNSKFLNKFLRILFSIDVFLAQKIKFPFGVSAFILATKEQLSQK